MKNLKTMRTFYLDVQTVEKIESIFEQSKISKSQIVEDAIKRL